MRRWGGDGWCAGLRRSGKPDGAAFSDWRWWPNSLKGHQLIALAQQRGRGREAKELLLRMTVSSLEQRERGAAVAADSPALLVQACRAARRASPACCRSSCPRPPPPLQYEEGANVSGVDALVGAATRLGLPEQEVRAHLEADAGRAAVLAEDERGKSE